MPKLPSTGNLFRFLACSCLLAASGLHANPAQLTPGLTLVGQGGDSVTGSGRWGFVGDSVGCALSVYLLNYQTMAWDYNGQILETNPQCPNTEFAASSSSSGNVMAVGTPGWSSGNPEGVFSVYEFDGTAWTTLANNKFKKANTSQVGSDFGRSISVGQQPGTQNYLVVIGAPLRDVLGLADAGAFEVWGYNATTDTAAYIGQVQGDAAGQRLGASVTVDYPFILAGRPGPVNTNGGGAVLYEVNAGFPPATLTLRQTLSGPGTSNMGENVSMSAAYALISGNSSAFVWINTGSASARTYAIREVSPGTPYSFPASGGGDVSQHNGVAGIGNGPPTAGSVYVIRNPMVDDFSFEGILTSFAPGDTSDVYQDVRRTREFLFAANSLEDRAVNYRFPAGFGLKQQAVGNTYPYKYMQRSLPCDAVGQTVSQVFGGLGVNGTDYVVYAYDISKRTDPNPYSQLANGYAFTAADMNYSLWIAVAAGKYVDIGACAGFTASDVIAPANGIITGLPAYVRAQKRIALPERDATALFARVMANNPYPREVNLNDIRYVDQAGTVQTLAQAGAASRIGAQFYVYDTDIGVGESQIPSGQFYRVLSTTPPFQDTLQPQEGFWVRVLANGVVGGANTHVLLMPQVE